MTAADCPAETAPEATKILVVEDEPDVREIVLDMLDAEGFQVAGAENGKAGVALAQQWLPDLVICDVMMPELDGYGVLQALRDRPETATVPFVFLTARAAKADLRQGMERGADDYLTKPFTRDELLSAIASRLKKQAAIAQASEHRLDELRSSITLSLPHELRTPLNGIVAASQFLLDSFDDCDRGEILEMLGDINRSGHRLHRLIRHFLTYAELELVARDREKQQALRRNRVRAVAAPIARAARDRVRDLAPEREGDLTCAVADGDLCLSESGLVEVVAELTDNAVKFSAPGQPVTVTGAIAGDRYRLTVADRGCGMTPEQIARVGAYQQFDRREREQQGAGLGLVIVKRLVEIYGGQLAIASEPGGGTRATLHLCLAPDAAPG